MDEEGRGDTERGGSKAVRGGVHARPGRKGRTKGWSSKGESARRRRRRRGRREEWGGTWRGEGVLDADPKGQRGGFRSREAQKEWNGGGVRGEAKRDGTGDMRKKIGQRKGGG